MTVKEILFKGLPFQPEFNQVFFIENDYDANANSVICNNYSELNSRFGELGMDFYYLPYILRKQDIEAKIKYYAPYLSTKILVTQVRSDAFAQYISDDDTRRNLKPSIIFGGNEMRNGEDTKFLQVELSEFDFTKTDAIDDLIRTVLQSYEESHLLMPIRVNFSRMPCDNTMSIRSFLTKKSDDDYKFNGIFEANNFEEKGRSLTERTEDEIAEEKSLIDTENVLRELRETVKKLRLEGVSLMAIHEFIDKQEPLSRMIITPDYRIFLPDYNFMEIEMGALPKAIYFLFLRYPEGIIYKHIQDYYRELLNIYKQLRPNTDESRLNLTITKVVNPFGNALNENIARIRKAFIEKFDEHLANNYIITGERGAQYLIPLDRDLITWEE